MAVFLSEMASIVQLIVRGGSLTALNIDFTDRSVPQITLYTKKLVRLAGGNSLECVIWLNRAFI